MIKVSAHGQETKQAEEDASTAKPELNARIQHLKDKASLTSMPKFHIQPTGHLKTLKMIPSSPEEEAAAEEEGVEEPTVYEQNLAPILIESQKARRVNMIGGLATALWIVGCGFYLAASQDGGFFQLSAQEMGGYLSIILAPAALLWLVLSNFQRRSDVEYYTMLLRSELHNILFPQGESPDKISKDVERLCRQASELSASSKAVMKSIQRARHGLREDVKGFLSLSKKTELHIDRLAANLNEKSERLLTVADDIEDRINRIEQASDLLEQKTKGMSERLKEAAETVSHTNNEALERLEKAEAGLEAQSRNISTVTSGLESEAGRIGDDLSIQLAHIQDLSDRILGSLDESAERIDSRVEGMKDVTEHLSGAANELVQKLDGITGGLGKQVDRALEKAGSLEGSISEVSETLEASLDELTKTVAGIRDAGDVAASALGESLSLAVSGSESLRESVKNAVGEFQSGLEAAIDKSQRFISTATEKVRDLRKEEDVDKDYLSEFFEKLSDQKEALSAIKSDIIQSIQKTSEHLDEKTKTLNLTLDRVSEISVSAERILLDPIQKIERVFDGFDERHERLSGRIDARLDSLSSVGEKVLSHVGQTADSLRDSVQDVSALSGQVAAQTQKINKDVLAQKKEISASINATLQDLSDVASTLEINVKNAEDYARKTENIISNINQNIKSNSEEMRGLSDGSINTLRDFGSQINEELARFDEICDSLEKKTHKASRNIEETLLSITPNCQDIFVKIEDLDHRFHQLKDTIADLSSDNISRLESLGQEFDVHILNVSRTVAEISTSLGGVNDNLQSCAKDIEQASMDASKRITAAQRDLKAQTDGFNILGDQVILKITGVQRALESQNSELSETIGAAVSQMKEAANELGDTARMTADVSEEVVAKITESVTHAEIQTETLQKAMESRIRQSSDLAAHISHQSQDLLEQGREHVKELDKVKNVFASRHKEMEAQLESVLRMSGYYGEEIRKQSKLVAQNAQETSDNISKAGKVLKNDMTSLSLVADEVSLKIRKAQSDMGQESKDLIRVSSEVLKHTEKATQDFKTQSLYMKETSRDLQKAAIDIRSIMNEQEQTQFISSARYVLESIYSLTVDLTRALNGGISEKMWKSFQDGDTSVFMRHLGQIEHNIPTSKLTEKYKKDPEFRTYATRYIKHFETMYAKVGNQEQDDLLRTAIGSSDVARLYRILGAAAGAKMMV